MRSIAGGSGELVPPKMLLLKRLIKRFEVIVGVVDEGFLFCEVGARVDGDDVCLGHLGDLQAGGGGLVAFLQDDFNALGFHG